MLYEALLLREELRTKRLLRASFPNNSSYRRSCVMSKSKIKSSHRADASITIAGKRSVVNGVQDQRTWLVHYTRLPGR